MLITSPSQYVFGGQPSRMSTVLAHRPNWAVSCARSSAQNHVTHVADPYHTQGTDGQHRGYSGAGISPAAETILHAQSTHEDPKNLNMIWCASRWQRSTSLYTRFCGTPHTTLGVTSFPRRVKF